MKFNCSDTLEKSNRFRYDWENDILGCDFTKETLLGELSHMCMVAHTSNGGDFNDIKTDKGIVELKISFGGVEVNAEYVIEKLVSLYGADSETIKHYARALCEEKFDGIMNKFESIKELVKDDIGEPDFY